MKLTRLKSAESFSQEPLIIVHKVQRLTTSRVHSIVALAVKGLAAARSLANVCEFMAESLNALESGRRWISMASTDPKMCGYVQGCEGYVQFNVDHCYFLVAVTER
eukprot:TRINITY_DN14641_c0_g1_i1.p2 TRINITY_DN14641_c0_g1~~TRINITY_DN14641_c0_g1_i1.p2  ORF type:complete len:106 (-),score=22.66 TRINITY_DN14641_c0_g1_i1:77-394(-)